MSAIEPSLPKGRAGITFLLGLDRDAQRALVRRWRHDPVAFAVDALAVDLWDAQQAIARAVRDFPRVAVRSCHAAGKTFLAAVVVLWFLCTHADALVLTTASTFRQVRYVLWRTIHRLATTAPLPIGADLTETELRLRDQWFALGLSTDHPERFQGFHAPHLLVVVDEPGAVPEPVFAAVEGVLASGHTRLLMIGNPTQSHGPFFDAFHSQAGAYRTFRLSAFDTPNLRGVSAHPEPVEGRASRAAVGVDLSAHPEPVEGRAVRAAVAEDLSAHPEPVEGRADSSPRLALGVDAAAAARPYLVTRDWVEERARMWGADSDLYRSRVLAEFPRHTADTLFPLALLDASLADEDDSAHPEPVEGRAARDLPTAHPEPVEARAVRAAVGVDLSAHPEPIEGRAARDLPAAHPEPVEGRAVRAAVGVDVARFGSDATAFSRIENGVLIDQFQLHGADTMAVSGRIAALLRDRPDLAVAVDDTGVGGGVVDRLRELGWEPIAVNFGAAATDREHYANRGSELYARLAQAFAQRRLTLAADLPTRDALFGQLTAVAVEYTSDGRRRLRKRGPTDSAPSPDLADSLALAWAAYEEGTEDPALW